MSNCSIDAPLPDAELDFMATETGLTEIHPSGHSAPRPSYDRSHGNDVPASANLAPALTADTVKKTGQSERTFGIQITLC
jgi:hypothetical protein